jgi:molecular chaperone HscB
VRLDADDFELFGLPRRQRLERAVLDARWRALQAEAHPDRFAAQGAAAQRVAMQWAMRLNQAHRRLKDPLERAAYLCELAGVPVRGTDNTAMPREFLLQQMQWREALEEAAGAEAVHALDAAVQRAEAQATAALESALDDAGDAASAAAQVRALMFVNRFRHDIERRLDVLDPDR